jgi:hypothetical protein
MSEQDLIKAEIEHIDPSKSGNVTESGELERPQLRRKIDCAGNPEITDRRFAGRGSDRTRDHR